MEQLQKDKDMVSNEIEEAQSQNNMWVRTEVINTQVLYVIF